MTMEPAPHKADFDRTTLELSLELAESAFGALKEIKVEKITLLGEQQEQQVTLSLHDWTPVPVMSLKLLLDQNHDLPAPEGMTLVTRGTALVEKIEKKIAVFRHD